MLPDALILSPAWAEAPPSARLVVERLDAELNERAGAVNGYLSTTRPALADHMPGHLIGLALSTARRLGFVQRGPGGWRLTHATGPAGEAPSADFLALDADHARRLAGRLATAEAAP
jgi:hypothetical protein